jgi:hypothetical protein
MLIVPVIKGCEMEGFYGPIKNNSMVTISFMLKALLKHVEYL